MEPVVVSSSPPSLPLLPSLPVVPTATATAAELLPPVIPQKEPAVVLVYGKSGVGKTSDMLFSFPTALFIAPPGALKPALSVIGYEPRIPKDAKGRPVELKLITEVTALMPRLREKGITACVIDDFSLLAERQVQLLDRSYTGWKLWQKMTEIVLDFRDTARHCGVHVAVNAHERPPSTTEKGKPLPGGPALPGQLVEKLPVMFDLVLRCAAAPDARRGWSGAYRCNPIGEFDWATRDRHGITPDYSPMNLAEILRLAGYTVDRLPALAAWQESAVTAISAALGKVTTPADEVAVLRAAVETIRAKQYTTNNLHIRWTLRDAVDRAYLIKARTSILSTFGI